MFFSTEELELEIKDANTSSNLYFKIEQNSQQITKIQNLESKKF